MSEDTTNEQVAVDLNDSKVVDVLLNDTEIAKLPLGSAEQKAALDKYFLSDKTNEESADPETEQNIETDELEVDDPSNTKDEVEEDNSTDESVEDTTVVKEEKKSKKGIQKRFDEMTKQIKDLERQLSKGGSTSSVVDPDAEFAEPKPKLKDFEEVEQFYEADAEWRYKKADHERSVKVAKGNIEQDAAQIAADWDGRAVAVKEKYSDYDTIVTTDSIKESNAQQAALVYAMRLEQGPELVYQVLSNPELLERFKTADQIEQVAILTELRLSLASPKTATIKVTKAPAPVRQLPKPGSTTNQTRYSDSMSQEEFDKVLDAELKRNKKARF